MSETQLTVVGALVLIGGPFLLLWFLDHRKQAQGVQPSSPAGRRLLRLLGILAVGIAVIVGVFYSCTWVMAAQPTVGKLNLATVVVAVVIVVFVAVILMQYVGLLGAIGSFISGLEDKETRTEEVMEASGPVEEAAQHPERAEEPSTPIDPTAPLNKERMGSAIILGIIGPVLAFAAGTLLGSAAWMPLDSVWHDIVSHPVFICSLAAWALALVALWRVILRAKEQKRSVVIVVALICTGGGLVFGLFWGFLWAVVAGYCC